MSLSISIPQSKFNNYYNYKTIEDNKLNSLVKQLGTNTLFANKHRNYTIYDYNLVNKILAYKEKALPFLKNQLQKNKSEAQVCEILYTLDKMQDLGIKNVDKLYPEFAKYNNTRSPEIQVLLAGLYRKTQVPDGFGPLIKMLIQNSISKDNTAFFDPCEEIGGAILEYIRSYNAKELYSTTTR